MPIEKISFTENRGLGDSRDRYTSITVDADRVIESWRESLFSFEWLDKAGNIKKPAELPEHEQPKRIAAEERIKSGQPFEQPVLGIGISDNIEIGMGRADFLTLAAHGIHSIRVHIPKSCESDFKPFLSDVKS